MRITELGHTTMYYKHIRKQYLKTIRVSWDARAESSIVSQVSVISEIEKLESIINCVIKLTLFRTDLALRS